MCSKACTTEHVQKRECEEGAGGGVETGTNKYRTSATPQKWFKHNNTPRDGEKEKESERKQNNNVIRAARISKIYLYLYHLYQVDVENETYISFFFGGSSSALTFAGVQASV